MPKNKSGERTDLAAGAAIITTSMAAGANAHTAMRQLASERPELVVKYSKGFQHLAALVRPEVKFALPTTLRAWQRKVRDMVSAEPDDRTIVWVYDPEGGAGKSTLVKVILAEYGGIQLEGKLADMSCAYNGQRVVVFDITRSSQEYSKHFESFAEKLKNGIIMKTKYDSECYTFKPPHVLFFSNSPPPEGVWTVDRVKLIKITRKTITMPGAVQMEFPGGGGGSLEFNAEDIDVTAFDTAPNPAGAFNAGTVGGGAAAAPPPIKAPKGPRTHQCAPIPRKPAKRARACGAGAGAGAGGGYESSDREVGAAETLGFEEAVAEPSSEEEESE